MTTNPEPRKLRTVIDIDGESWRPIRVLDDGLLLVRRALDGRVRTVKMGGAE